MFPISDATDYTHLQVIRDHFGEEIFQRVIGQGIGGGKDLFSEVFEKVMTHSERKEFGQFFTHQELVNYIISRIPLSQMSTVIDPACGAGAFLCATAKLYDRSHSLYGVDINKGALDLCQLNLESSDFDGDINLLNRNSINNLSLSDFPEVASKGGFDCALGNPPFMNLKKGEDYDASDNLFAQVVNGVANSSTLIIAKTLSLLKEGGWLGFVLPKNILRVNSFSALRDYLARRTEIHEIYDLGHYFKDVRGDQMILILRNRQLSTEQRDEHLIKVRILSKGEDFEAPTTYHIAQSQLLRFDHFPIFLNDEILPLAGKMLGADETLAHHSDIFRGLSYGSNHELVSSEKQEGWRRLYRGDSIRSFGIEYDLWLNPEFINSTPASKLSRLSQPKIAVQNICSREGGLRAMSIDRDDLTLDTITNVIPFDRNLLNYMTALLNSRLANFFTIVVLYLHSNFTMHTDKMYIGRIPFVMPTPTQLNEVNSLVQKICKSDVHSAAYVKIYEKIQELLYTIYEIDEESQEIISNSLREVMSAKSFC